MTESTTLTDKVALVTGGSRNIGRATAIALAGKGADVIVTYRTNDDLAAEVVAEIEGLGRRGAALAVDLTGTANIDGLVADFRKVLVEWGRSDFDILVNNAGILRIAPFDQVTEDDLDANFETNYKSVFMLTQALAGDIADGGRIINLGSGTACIAFGPLVSYGPL